MSDPYEEIVNGQRVLRLPLRKRHEEILSRLHRRVAGATASLVSTKLLAPRTRIEVSFENVFCPDLALVTSATDKVWLVAEVISSDDHHADTMDKKGVYEELKLPRLWMIDPRYDNVEVYHATKFGLVLQGILAGHEILAENLLPEFQFTVAELFLPGT